MSGSTISESRRREKSSRFSGRILDVDTPVITVMGTDCAVGKRTTAVNLVEALKKEGLNTVFVATGQTGLLQGAKYGVAVDVLSSGFSTGEVEHAILEAQEQRPDIIVVEGQGALSHPAFTSSAAILRGAIPDAIIIQHPPKRINHCDYPRLSHAYPCQRDRTIGNVLEVQGRCDHPQSRRHEQMTRWPLPSSSMNVYTNSRLPMS